MFNANHVDLKKEEIEKVIEEKNILITYVKPKETTITSKSWSQFSQICIAKAKQDYIICDICKSILIYKGATGFGGSDGARIFWDGESQL
ncbi:unnamed protein product [Rotaria sordida]|uniref:Uncharacterized protein n=1 Tax=Rotaria sordida TaxID=392033 RepID=A0A819T8H8_9BILA|nr:unnamed protein product [Rotaria sordida]CAF4072638.1 unnamed protein product [Rotaria sordida]